MNITNSIDLLKSSSYILISAGVLRFVTSDELSLSDNKLRLLMGSGLVLGMTGSFLIGVRALIN